MQTPLPQHLRHARALLALQQQGSSFTPHEDNQPAGCEPTNTGLKSYGTRPGSNEASTSNGTSPSALQLDRRGAAMQSNSSAEDLAAILLEEDQCGTEGPHVAFETKWLSQAAEKKFHSSAVFAARHVILQL